MQRESADIWKKNILEDLESGEVEFELVEEFLLELKKKFERENEESVKVAELKRGGRTMEEFIQEFRRVARGSKYKESALVEKFKRGINKVIKRKLMEAERMPMSIEQ